MFGKKKLFQDRMEPRCAYCAKGALLDDEQVLCARRGLMDPGASCHAFQYDPMKRVPPRPVSFDFGLLTDEDFKL